MPCAQISAGKEMSYTPTQRDAADPGETPKTELVTFNLTFPGALLGQL